MAGTTKDIAIASNALLLLGHQPIADFEEGTAGAQIASNLYDTSYDSLLTTYRWRFATKKVTLGRLTETPLNGFQYQYQLPSDLLYLIGLERANTPYEIYEDKLYSDLLEVSVDYTYKVTADKLPAYYAKALEFYLAAQFAVPLTDDINKAKLYSQLYDRQLRQAKHNDATQRPNVSFVDNPYIDVRTH